MRKDYIHRRPYECGSVYPGGGVMRKTIISCIRGKLAGNP